MCTYSIGKQCDEELEYYIEFLYAKIKPPSYKNKLITIYALIEHQNVIPL